MLEKFDHDEITQIVAGSLQLGPVDSSSRTGAIASLGSFIGKDSTVWVARDATTAIPRAYVALNRSGHRASVASAIGLDGTHEDACQAADAVRRYAVGALGLDSGSIDHSIR
ncbi:MAG: hypothetical protein WCI74_03665 [Actinomycetes bacterium]